MTNQYNFYEEYSRELETKITKLEQRIKELEAKLRGDRYEIKLSFDTHPRNYLTDRSWTK